jgi:DNA-binding cell septation regulator SpoVG
MTEYRVRAAIFGDRRAVYYPSGREHGTKKRASPRAEARARRPGRDPRGAGRDRAGRPPAGANLAGRDRRLATPTMDGMRPARGAVRRAGEAAGFGGHPLRLLKWQTYQNPAGTMRGFFSVELPSGMIVREMRLMRSAQGRHWLAMPAQQQLERDGQPRLPNGKPVWNELVDFRDRQARDRFQEPILALLRREHPEAFE